MDDRSFSKKVVNTAMDGWRKSCFWGGKADGEGAPEGTETAGLGWALRVALSANHQ